MFQKIMTPVDLAHVEDTRKALQCSAELAKLYNAEVSYVGVSAPAPSEIAHNLQEFSSKLDAFAEEQAAKHGIATTARVEPCNDPTTDVDDALLRAVKATDADLVVMQSHLPKLSDYVWPSNGGKVVRHSDVTVMVVRN